MHGKLANCPGCGRLFVRGVQTVCEQCRRETEEQFEKVYHYVRKKENRRATVSEVSQATKVKEKTIYRFIREGRLELADFPNLGYPCESCGAFIRQGKVCEACRRKFNKALDEMEKRVRENSEAKNRRQTYYSD